MIKQFCPLKKAHHDLLRPGIPPSPIKVEELPGEFVMRHRDSDYQFTQEFEVKYNRTYGITIENRTKRN